MTDIDEHLKRLREALTSLDNTGPDGFEGLIAAVLTEISGMPFRLASSGSQHGRDGESDLDHGATYFETKLYTTPLPKNEVLSKITEAGVGGDGRVDTWILASTQAVSAQHTTVVRQAAETFGIGLLLLDWAPSNLPLLALILAMGHQATNQFFRARRSAIGGTLDISHELEAIRGHPGYAGAASALEAAINGPMVALASAAVRSGGWLRKAFSSRRRALADLGQPLAPADPGLIQATPRPALTAVIAEAFHTPSVVAVLGDEGCGKSWLVAQTWLQSDPPPLMLLFTPDQFAGQPSREAFGGLVIEGLLRQTSAVAEPGGRQRWARRLGFWVQARGGAPPVVVVVDGLNQAPRVDWARWVNAGTLLMEDIGGSLVLTSRAHFFTHSVRHGLHCAFHELVVPEWSVDEVQSILQANGSNPAKLNAELILSLRNPRLLGLALELLGAAEVEQLSELSDDRLLFEYMRRYAAIGPSGLSPSQFASDLKGQAEELIEVLKGTGRADAVTLDAVLDERLHAVAQTRFFRPLDGEPSRYRLAGEGIPVALGLAVVDALAREERVGGDPLEALSSVLEPIQALDRTADVIGAAVVCAALDSRVPHRVTSAFVRSYVDLQNLPRSNYEAFVALARVVPSAFMEAAWQASVSTERVPYIEWLIGSLRAVSEHEAAWPLISAGIEQWLSTHSLAVTTRVQRRLGRDPEEQVKEEVQRREAELATRLAALGASEKQILAQCQLVDGLALDGAHELGFTLLAGKPLAGFASCLVRWAFMNSLNGSWWAPTEQFQHLLQFTTLGWGDVRKAMLKAAAPLREPGTSAAGEWALVAVLRSTGATADADEASLIARRLTEDRERIGGWRLVESYCASDPCDPGSKKPSNIDDTAAKFGDLDVSLLRCHMAQTREDHFFEMARTGVARFAGEVATRVQRAFIDDVANRTGMPLRQGAWPLPDHSSLLTPQMVERLIRAAEEVPHSGDTNQDEWATAQYLLWATFPHLQGDHQWGVISRLPGRSLLVNLLRATRPASEMLSSGQLAEAITSADVDQQVKALSFLYFSASPVPDGFGEVLPSLLASADSMVRAYSMAIAAGSEDDALLNIVVASWAEREESPFPDGNESWYGAKALSAAAGRGLIPVEDCVDRISPRFYDLFVELAGIEAARLVAHRVDAAVRRVTAVPDLPLQLRIERDASSEDGRTQPFFDVSEELESTDDLRSALERLTESSEAFSKRQERVREKFTVYWKQLDSVGGQLVLEALSTTTVREVLGAEPGYANDWLQLLQALDDNDLSKVHRLAVLIARAAASTHPRQVEALVRRLHMSEGAVRFVSGIASVPEDRVAVWSIAVKVPKVQQLCFQRLDAARSDAELALEVLSASLGGAGGDLQRYIKSRLARTEPAWMARAITVAGLMDVNAHSDAVITQWQHYRGMIGDAVRFARDSYYRNQWARHWYSQMAGTNQGEEFWRCAILLSKIIDGRCVLWWPGLSGDGEYAASFAPLLHQRLKRRIKKWGDSRKKTLFGRKPPEPVFLEAGMRGAPDGWRV